MTYPTISITNGNESFAVEATNPIYPLFLMHAIATCQDLDATVQEGDYTWSKPVFTEIFSAVVQNLAPGAVEAIPGFFELGLEFEKGKHLFRLNPAALRDREATTKAVLDNLKPEQQHIIRARTRQIAHETFTTHAHEIAPALGQGRLDEIAEVGPALLIASAILGEDEALSILIATVEDYLRANGVH